MQKKFLNKEYTDYINKYKKDYKYSNEILSMIHLLDLEKFKEFEKGNLLIIIDDWLDLFYTEFYFIKKDGYKTFLNLLFESQEFIDKNVINFNSKINIITSNFINNILSLKSKSKNIKKFYEKEIEGNEVRTIYLILKNLCFINIEKTEVSLFFENIDSLIIDEKSNLIYDYECLLNNYNKNKSVLKKIGKHIKS